MHVTVMNAISIMRDGRWRIKGLISSVFKFYCTWVKLSTSMFYVSSKREFTEQQQIGEHRETISPRGIYKMLRGYCLASPSL